MMSLRKFLFRTGEKMMVWSFAISLLIPAFLERCGILKRIKGNGERVTLAAMLGVGGFFLLLPITFPLLSIGWGLTRISGLSKA